jgi:hypothetical protein
MPYYWVQGVTPAEGSVKPIVGFTLDMFLLLYPY